MKISKDKALRVLGIPAEVVMKAAELDDLDDACRLLQDCAGVESGDVAGVFFTSGDLEEWPHYQKGYKYELLFGYIRMEASSK